MGEAEAKLFAREGAAVAIGDPRTPGSISNRPFYEGIIINYAPEEGT